MKTVMLASSVSRLPVSLTLVTVSLREVMNAHQVSTVPLHLPHLSPVLLVTTVTQLAMAMLTSVSLVLITTLVSKLELPPARLVKVELSQMLVQLPADAKAFIASTWLIKASAFVRQVMNQCQALKINLQDLRTAH